MSYPIPEDLKRRYEHSKTWLERNRENHPLLRVSPEAHDNFIRIDLIDRIARLEAQNKALLEALELCDVESQVANGHIGTPAYEKISAAIEQARKP